MRSPSAFTLCIYSPYTPPGFGISRSNSTASATDDEDVGVSCCSVCSLLRFPKGWIYQNAVKPSNQFGSGDTQWREIDFSS